MKEMIKKYKGTLFCIVLVMLALREKCQMN